MARKKSWQNWEGANSMATRPANISRLIIRKSKSYKFDSADTGRGGLRTLRACGVLSRWLSMTYAAGLAPDVTHWIPMTYVATFLLDMLTSVCYNAAMKKRVRTKPRARVEWNTGERIHLPKKGKGSYNRKKSKKSSWLTINSMLLYSHALH